MTNKQDEMIGFFIIGIIVLSIIVSIFGTSHTPKDDYNQDRAELQWGGF